MISQDVDASAILVYFPLNDGNEVFDYTPPVNEDEMTLLSIYNVTHGQHISDILFMYATIPEVVWYGVLLSFLIFVSILHIGQRILRPKLSVDPIWSTFAAYVDQDDYSFTISDQRYARFLVVISISISIVAFFTSNFINNSVGTEMVVIDKAYAPSSYKEVLDRGMKAALTKMMPEYEKFRDSPKNSHERKIYENAIYFSVEPESFVALRERALYQKIALVGRRLLTEVGAYGVLLMLSNQYPDSRALLTKDPQAKKYTSVFAMNQNTDKQLKYFVSKT